MAQSSSKESARNRRVAAIMLGLLALAIAAVIAASNWVLDTARQQMYDDMQLSMNTQAGNKVALLTVWSGTVRSQVEAFSDLDLVRLFAAEVADTAVSAERLLEVAQRPETHMAAPPLAQPPAALSDIGVPLTPEDDGFGTPTEVAPQAPVPLAIDVLAPRLPTMYKQLQNFVEKNNLWGAYLLNRDLECYLTPGAAPELSTAQRGFLTGIFENRKPVYLPVRRQSGELIMDIAFPIFSPPYLEAGAERVVGVLVVSYNVLPLARAVTRAGGVGERFSTAVLQMVWDNLQSISPGTASGYVDLPGWTLSGGRLPLKLRDMPASGDKIAKVFSLALPVPGMPWYVAQWIDAGVAQDQYENFRQNVVIAAVLVAALAGILLAALWWWLVGRRERAVADQLRRLYMALHQQKQIMDGVNTASSAGIVLNDLNGMLHYANQGFALMAGRKPEELLGLAHTELPLDLARSLVTHTLEVRRSGARANFTEAMRVDENTHHYLTACSPFHNEKGEVSGVVSVYSDITGLVLAQQRAQLMVTQTVAVFVRAIEAVDPYLCGQSAFTAHLSTVLAGLLKVDDAETMATLRTAASLSQVGMIQLPRELLTKTGVLTPGERMELRQHVAYARRALEGIDFGLPVLEAICRMHERLDGTGYPEGLSGEQIGMHARILAAANTFCALMRPRSYRTAMDIDAALDILSETPHKYDPRVVEALRRFLKSDDGRAFLARLCEQGGEARP